jgi:hypothetical protein
MDEKFFLVIFRADLDSDNVGEVGARIYDTISSLITNVAFERDLPDRWDNLFLLLLRGLLLSHHAV